MKARHILMTMTLAMIPATLFSAQDDVFGTRIDYFNKQGKRILSTYPTSMSESLFTGYLYENGWEVNCGQYYFNSIKMIPYGTESYIMNIQSDIPLEYTIKTSEAKPARLRAEMTKEETILSGTTVVFRVEVPETEYPVVRDRFSYTDEVFGDDVWRTASEAPFSSYFSVGYNHRNPSIMANQEWVDYILKYIKGDGAFTLVSHKDGKNVWELEFVMPNEPCRLEFGTASEPDGKRLRDIADWTMYYGLYTQYSGLDWNGNNGEAWVLEKIGNGLSQDVVNSMYNFGGSSFTELFGSMDALKSAGNYLNLITWADYYALIMRANILLDNLDLFRKATASEREIVRAQMLALRAHAYTRILQLYGKRWSESDNGSAYCAPLIISSTDIQRPLATMKDIYAQAESDLLNAERIFKENNYTRTDILQPDINVVHALQMRLYMLHEDWTAALDAANSILDVYPLSTNEDMQSGFYLKRDSWIWGASSNYAVDGNNLSIYYWAPQNYNACNGAYPAAWGMGCNAIDRDLFLQIPENDIRRSFFMMPESLNKAAYGRIDTWYNSNNFTAEGFLAYNKNRDYKQTSNTFSEWFKDRKSEGALYGPFINYQFQKEYVPVQFGSQIKFQGSGSGVGYDFTSGTPATLFIRSDEALLSAAEAAVMLGNDAKARELLDKLNKMRNPDYVASVSTGDALLQEIRTCRRIELWGEGHSWFDFKRWNMPIHRNIWKEGDTASGNWLSVWPENVSTDAANGWRFAIPSPYLNYNPNIDITKMGYKDVTGYQQASKALKHIAPPVPGKVSGSRGIAGPSTAPAPAFSNSLYME